jgi:trehalose 6-phosphate synthase
MKRPGDQFIRYLWSWASRFGRGRNGGGATRLWVSAIYGSGVVAAIVLLFLFVSPLIAGLVEQWGRSDVELRAKTINESARDQAERLLRDNSPQALERLEKFFDRIASDEQLVAVAVCNRSGSLRLATKGFPGGLACDSIEDTGDGDTNDIEELGGRSFLVSAFPFSNDELGRLVIIHDLTFAKSRAGEARLYVILALAAVVILAGGSAALISTMLLRGWQETMRGTISDLRAGRVASVTPETIGRELREALEQYDLTRRSIDGIHVDWTPETLKHLLSSELPGVQVIAVSNREPYIHNRDSGGVRLQIPASGLVAALEPIIRACSGTWIAHGSGSADMETVDANDRIGVPPGEPSYTLRRVWLSSEEQEGYYYGLANEGLWPLCHIAFVRPIFREANWRQYKEVNEKFADAVVQEARCEDPVVLVQDYHFALLPKLIRERLPKANVITFWHIPWPNAETFSICPWKEEIVEGLLGSSILGFHTHFHCNNFLETVDRFVESRIDREWRSVLHNGNETLIRPYPISIEWPPTALASQQSVEDCRTAVRRKYDLRDDILLGVGIERFDYTKGILDRIRAVDNLLRRHPEWRGRFTFIQAAAPSRDKLASYQSLQQEATSLVQEVNARHGLESWLPIILSVRHHEPGEVFELYRAADACVVSSLHDGMNLVAKEFVAARDDERGVLILSTFAGASRELNEALIVNPYHTLDMAEAIHRALSMPEGEQRARMQLMRALVRSRNVYCWAGQMLLDCAQLRRRGEIERIATANAARRGPGSRQQMRLVKAVDV